MAMETIRRTQPMTNTNHNLLQLLNEKLDSAARYELYRKDAEGISTSWTCSTGWRSRTCRGWRSCAAPSPDRSGRTGGGRGRLTRSGR